MKYSFEVRNSIIEGKGIFATSDIKKGEVVCEFKGEEITIKELKQKYDSDKERIDDPFQIDDKIYLDLFEPFVYFNHSCNPNLGVRGKGTLFALRDIKEGEELAFDYSTTEWTDDEAWGIDWTEKWRMPCKCGSIECRKEIRVFSLLPQQVKEKYRAEGALMDFVLKKYLSC